MFPVACDLQAMMMGRRSEGTRCVNFGRGARTVCFYRASVLTAAPRMLRVSRRFRVNA